MADLKTVYGAWLEERRLSGMTPLSSDAHIHIAALIERFEAIEKAEKSGSRCTCESKDGCHTNTCFLMQSQNLTSK